MAKKRKPLTEKSEWTYELIDSYYKEVEKIGVDEMEFDVYPNQIEIISSEQMLDAYASIGLPVHYNHWSFGKQFIQQHNAYKKGHMGLAYELVINSDPCISYLMEENTMMMQILVMAHACIGHNYVFKNNYLFKQWTNANVIVDYLLFAKKFISDCEEKYGILAVENILDSCHALMEYGVDKYKRPPSLSINEEKLRQQEREAYLQSQVNDLWKTIPKTDKVYEDKVKKFPEEPEENILYFIEKNAPMLDSWKREIIRIVRNLSQYFYPQRLTKTLNEGAATFIHYQIMHKLREKNLINDGFMLEFFKYHTGVVRQPEFDSRSFNGLNPYAVGFAIFQDIKRVCENPTPEDKRWFPAFAGDPNWLEQVKFAIKNFKDESFIQQYLSPKVIRDFRLFSFQSDENDPMYEITNIHNDDGYMDLREILSREYCSHSFFPDIQVFSVDLRGDRSLVLHHYMDETQRPLYDEDNNVNEMLKHVKNLWEFDVHLESYNDNKRNKLNKSWNV